MKKLNYEELSIQLEDWAGISSSSEIHGLVSGLASVGHAADFGLVETVVKRHIDESECPSQAQQGLQAMQETVLEQLDDTNFAFETLIPNDDEELFVRVQALAEWCQGFLVGFGTGVKANELEFSDEAQEVLRDLVEISKVDPDREETPEEEDEVALNELEEYVRTAVMMLYSEFVLKRASAKSQNQAETLH
jgi:uncharacterized protein YgfB (UPF0149 family)